MYDTPQYRQDSEWKMGLTQGTISWPKDCKLPRNETLTTVQF